MLSTDWIFLHWVGTRIPSKSILRNSGMTFVVLSRNQGVLGFSEMHFINDYINDAMGRIKSTILLRKPSVSPCLSLAGRRCYIPAGLTRGPYVTLVIHIEFYDASMSFSSGSSVITSFGSNMSCCWAEWFFIPFHFCGYLHFNKNCHSVVQVDGDFQGILKELKSWLPLNVNGTWAPTPYGWKIPAVGSESSLPRTRFIPV